MALKDLIADRGKITEEHIEKIVSKFVRYDPKAVEVIFTPEAMQLNNEAKVLLYLVSIAGWEYVLDEEPDIETNPQALQEVLGIPGGSLRPTLKKLRESNLVSVSNSRYSIRPANLESIGKIINGEKKPPKPSKPSAKKTKSQSTNSDGSNKAASAKRGSGTPIKPSLERLLNDGFFQEYRTLRKVIERLHEQAIIAKTTSLSGPIAELVRNEKLERKKIEESGQQVWAYKAK